MRTSALAIATSWHGRPARDRGTDALVRHRADIPETLFSLAPLLDSIKILRDKTGVKYKDGVRDEVLMKPYTIPSKILAENERWKDGSRKFAWRYGSNPQVEAFRNIFIYCAEQRIDLRIFTNPLHAEMLDIEYGDGVDFAAWAEWLTIPKSGLVERVEISSISDMNSLSKTSTTSARRTPSHSPRPPTK